jgi:hypothetical protein
MHDDDDAGGLLPRVGKITGPEPRRERGEGVRCQWGDDQDGIEITTDDQADRTSTTLDNIPGPMPLSPEEAEQPQAPANPPRKLRGLKLRFVNAYQQLRYENATEALRRCGVRGRGDNWLRSKASAILKEPAVQAEIERRIESESIGPGRVVAEVARMATLEPAEIGTLYVMVGRECRRDHEGPCGAPCGPLVRRFDWDGAKARGVSRAVARVRLDRTGNETAEWHDPMQALALLAKVHGLTSESTHVHVDVSTLSIAELQELARG